MRTFLWTLILCSSVQIATTFGEEHKLKILKEVADLHVANRDKLNTWEGQVQIVDSDVRPGQKRSSRSKVEFALNRKEDLYRWTLRQSKIELLVNGKPDPDVRTYHTGGMRTAGGIVRLDGFDEKNGFDETQLDRPQMLDVRSRSYFHPGAGSLDFDPMYYFQDDSRTVESTFLMYYDMSATKHPRRITTTKGTHVILSSDFNSVNRYTIDLAQGANLIEAYFTESNVNGTLVQETKTETKHKELSGVWVPFEVVHTSKRPLDGIEVSRTIKWTSQSVNGEIKDSAFDLNSIGAQDGDIAIDAPPGLNEYDIKDGRLVPRDAIGPFP